MKKQTVSEHTRNVYVMYGATNVQPAVDRIATLEMQLFACQEVLQTALATAENLHSYRRAKP